MRRTLLAAAAAAMLAVPAPGAVASHGPPVRGGCFVAIYSDQTNRSYVGVVGALAVFQKADGTPASGTIRCKIQVDGDDATPTFAYSGTGVVAGANVVSFDAGRDASVTLCEDTGHGFTCGPATQLPPPEVRDLLLITPMPDLMVCPVLASLFPPHGDLVLPEPIGTVRDCPPFEG